MPSSGENSPISDHLGGTSYEMSPGSAGGSTSPSKTASSKRVEGKRCGVCGDRALGYNFNAITCESCKAFFRRNALKNKEYRCPFNDECEVTAVTRRFCQRCRLRKCFEVGMKKEWIMSEEEKKKKRKKIQENRARKMGDIESSSPSSSSPSSPPSGGGGGVSIMVNSGSVGAGEQLLLSASSVLQKSCSTDVDEERSAAFGAPIPDLPSLPLKSPASGVAPPKPKAVVVGRVRVEEKEAKVRKISVQSDVHNSKIITAPIVPPKVRILSAQVRDDASSSYSPPKSHLGEESGIPMAHHYAAYLQQQPQPHQDTTDPSASSLVVGLLRAHSHGSAEDEPPLLPPTQALACQTDEKLTQTPGVIVKRESEEDIGEGDIGPCLSYEFSSPASEPPDSYHHQNSNLLAEDIKSEVRNHHTGDPASRFDFSIQEALNLIQPGCKERWSSSTFMSSSSGNNVMESIMNTAISAEYSAFSLLTNSLSSELNQVETIKITELLEASRGLNSPLCEEPNYKDSPNPSLINVINLTEIAIRRLIKMAKKISAFKMFCREDQIALLKGGCTEMMILRSVSAYDPDKEVWKIQQDYERFKNIKLKVLKAAPGNVYEEHKRFILSFEPEWRNDTRIIALLAAIALFTPERPNVVHKDAVRHEQSSYLYLLKRYMECTYGGCVGKTFYLKLLEIIGNLHILNEDHVRVFLDVNPQEVAPLLIEIFDLKQS